MSIKYKEVLKILQKWPLDKSKAGRDLGERLRSHLTTLHNPAGKIDHCLKKIDSLGKLCNNINYINYKRIYASTATGLSAQQCSQVLSSEFLQYLNDADKN